MIILATGHFNKASQLHKIGKTDEAIAELQLAIDDDPGDTRSRLALAAMYEACGQRQKAKDQYTTVLQADVDHPQANLRLGILLTTMGSYAAALTPLRMAWSNDNKSSSAANALAQALDASGDYGTAKAMYEEALKLDPTLANARYNLGTLCYNEEDYEAAISHFKTFIARAGENSRAHRNIGKALLRMGQLDSAIASFMKAQELDPNDPTVYYNLAIVYNIMNKTEASFYNFRKALKLYPKYTEARYTFAKALLFHEQVTAAQLEFMTVVTQSPDHARALNGLGSCFLKQNDYTSAAAFLRQALDLAPEFAYAHYNLGIALRSLGFEYEANHHFKEAAHFDQSGHLTHQASGAARSARITRSSNTASGGMSQILQRQIAA